MTATESSPGRPRLPIVILISGRGSNMRVIAERAANNELPVEVRAVISDRSDAAGLRSAAGMGLPVASLSPRDYSDRAAYDTALVNLVAEYEPELVVLAGFMRILTAHFIEAFAGRLLNIHPSLLPRHRGLHTHKRAIEAGDTIHGASVHFVTQELDGGPVIIQACVPVQPQDTHESLSARVQRQEHRIYPRAIEWFACGRLQLRDDAIWLDGRPLDQPVMIESVGD
jgi:phosphoribosylglycinamide formyltransferase-1